MDTIAVIIVTHNAQAVLPRCLDALEQQSTPPDYIILVDSGSSKTDYLQAQEKSYTQQEGRKTHLKIFLKENIGFSQSNNIGYQAIAEEVDFVLFLNPDAFLAPNSIELALAFLVDQPAVGCVGARLLGFDQESGSPSGRLDSTGVFRAWYGRWYDRHQGEIEDNQGQTQDVQEEVPALCGAFLFCRNTMLKQVALPGNHPAIIFDPDFFLYKEDIELCLRIRKAGWQIIYLPEVIAYHCRGWQKKRRQMSYSMRLTAAKSELLLYRKHPSPYIFWALLKYLLVRFLRQ